MGNDNKLCRLDDPQKSDLKEPLSSVTPPTATYRLQMGDNMGFQDVLKTVIPYIKQLGISHLYLSPIFKAHDSSEHGYDVVDPRSLNPRLGSDDDFEAMCEALKRNGIKLILDIVPNHMSATPQNKWFNDVLMQGELSRYSDYFDIDWQLGKTAFKHKILLPVLGESYGQVLLDGGLEILFDRQDGVFKLNCSNQILPITPVSYSIILQCHLEQLSSKFDAENLDLMEYLSIIRAFDNIANCVEENSLYNPLSVHGKLRLVRYQETIIAQERLARLCHRNSVIDSHVDSVLSFLNTEPARTNLHRVLEAQHYRLANWRVAKHEINYRRFFDINELIGLRTESPRVFNLLTSRLLEWIEKDYIHGLRIDHIDGLYNPQAFLFSLQEACAKARKMSFRLELDSTDENQVFLNHPELPFYVTVEKILAHQERLPWSWPVHGTTGYETANALTGVFVKQDNEKRFSALYARFSGFKMSFEHLAYESKHFIMQHAMVSELTVLANMLDELSESSLFDRDYTQHDLQQALAEVIACFPIYRTYVLPGQATSRAKHFVSWAVGLAKKRAPNTDPAIFDFIQRCLLLENQFTYPTRALQELAERLALKFQQYTAPVLAKGVEDTSFYRYNRLLALNEVGGDPAQFGISVSEFHRKNQARLEQVPHCMIASSTHDHKRSEDIRARLCVLSEMPGTWRNFLNRMLTFSRSRKRAIDDSIAPSQNDEYLFYQIWLSAWPDDVDSKRRYFDDESYRQHFLGRLQTYMLKAIKEAKVNTTWANPNLEYEEALKTFVESTLLASETHPQWGEFFELQSQLSLFGQHNSLSQLVLKLTIPGVPDIYQGSELKMLSLVDPDNRYTIDFDSALMQLNKHVQSLSKNSIEGYSQLTQRGAYSELKQLLTYQVLSWRHKYEDLFRYGDYHAVPIEGAYADHLVAYLRQDFENSVLVLVPRFLYTLSRHQGTENTQGWSIETLEQSLPQCLAEAFSKTFLELNVMPDPQESASKQKAWYNVLTQQQVAISDTRQVCVGDLFKGQSLPVVILHLSLV
jgi:(1->4)-alpha-D-glucan 1-alpha-D-glucosylmutase